MAANHIALTTTPINCRARYNINNKIININKNYNKRKRNIEMHCHLVQDRKQIYTKSMKLIKLNFNVCCFL